MVSVKKPKAASVVIASHPDVCKWTDKNIESQSQIIAITHSNGMYTIFYYK
jgi:hypothetical protein